MFTCEAAAVSLVWAWVTACWAWVSAAWSSAIRLALAWAC